MLFFIGLLQTSDHPTHHHVTSNGKKLIFAWFGCGVVDNPQQTPNWKIPVTNQNRTGFCSLFSNRTVSWFGIKDWMYTCNRSLGTRCQQRQERPTNLQCHSRVRGAQRFGKTMVVYSNSISRATTASLLLEWGHLEGNKRADRVPHRWIGPSHVSSNQTILECKSLRT